MKDIFNIDTDALWQKVSEWARKAGRAATRPVILLWMVMKDKNTPKSDKLLVATAISYLVLPIDILNAKRLPVIGWFDEIASITVAYQKVCKHVTPEMQARADELLDRWFPNPVVDDYTEYELIEE